MQPKKKKKLAKGRGMAGTEEKGQQHSIHTYLSNRRRCLFLAVRSAYIQPARSCLLECAHKRTIRSRLELIFPHTSLMLHYLHITFNS